MAQALSRTALRAREFVSMIPACSQTLRGLPTAPVYRGFRMLAAHQQARRVCMKAAAADIAAAGMDSMAAEEFEALPDRTITAMGRLTNDWTVRSVNTRVGVKPVANTKLELEDDFYDEDDEGMGQRRPRSFKPRLELTVWGQDAEAVAEQFKRGDLVRVNGSFNLSKFADRTTPGKEHVSIRVTVRHIARVKEEQWEDNSHQ